MKKIILTLMALATGAALVQAQGFLTFSSGTSFGATTNNGAGGSGKISASAAAPFGYDFTFLYIATGIGTAGDLANLNSGNWVQLALDLGGTPGALLMGTNAPIAGNFAGNGGAGSVQAIGSNGAAFNSGTSYSLALVGWSANLGSTWAAVAAQLQSGNWVTPAGFFGYETATVNPSSAVPGNTPTAMFGNNTFVVSSVPEPTTLALAGLGGLSMLFLRRRKS
jgi:hypothetical protein